MQGALYTRLSIVLSIVLSILGACLFLWALYMTVKDLSRARKLRSLQSTAGALARLSFLPAAKTGAVKQVFEITNEGRAGSTAACDVRLKLPGEHRVLFEYRVSHGTLVVTPMKGVTVSPSSAKKNAKKVSPTDEVTVLPTGSHCNIDGRYNMCFEMLKRPSPESPSNKRAYRRKGR